MDSSAMDGTPPPGSDVWQGEAWRLELPPGLRVVVVSPPPECTSMAHLRGEIAPGAPALGVVSTQERDRSARACVRRLAASFEPPHPEPRAAAVAGARGAWRIDGRLDMEEGLTADGIERIAVVVAARRHDLVVLTVRTRPDDDVGDAVDRLIASFAVREPSGPRAPEGHGPTLR
jgi:hypothetical protein